MSLDDLFHAEESEQPGSSRRWMAAQTFALTVVAAIVGVALLALLLYGLGTGATALWNHWWADFG